MALQLGPIVGEVTHSSAKIWFRADAEGTYTCHVFTDPTSPTEVPGSRQQAVVSQATGRTATFEVALPNADQLYYYDIRGPGGNTILPGGRLSFKNAPTPGTPTTLTFAFVSCHKPFEYAEAQRFVMWDKMDEVFKDKNVRFLLMIGDQVYADKAFKEGKGKPYPDVVKAYREVYQQYWEHASVMRILGRYPTYMIWDDHEIRDNWGSEEGDKETHPIFQAARQVYCEFQHCHNPYGCDPENPENALIPEKLHYAFEFGQVGFLVLDLRGHRHAYPDDREHPEDLPVLGPKQWDDISTWLAEEAPKYRVLFIVCSVPMVHKSRAIEDTIFLRDHWSSMKNRREQQELVRLLFEELNKRARENGNPQQIIILGGNNHEGSRAEIRSDLTEHNTRRRIYQFTSSPISNKPISDWELGARSADPWFWIDDNNKFFCEVPDKFNQRNFGLVHVNYDSGADNYRVVFELHREGKSPYTFST